MTYESLKPEGVQQLQLFADNANWLGLHPLDWNRYFDFVIGTHQRHEPALPSEIMGFLVDAGGPKELSSKIAEFYEPALDLLRYYDEQT